jgi:hypothetical protein
MKTQPISRKVAAQCAEWNRLNPMGAEVIVTKDSGEEVSTKTRGEAFVSNSGQPVIFLAGVSGYYLLDRVRAAPNGAQP